MLHVVPDTCPDADIDVRAVGSLILIKVVVRTGLDRYADRCGGVAFAIVHAVGHAVVSTGRESGHGEFGILNVRSGQSLFDESAPVSETLTAIEPPVSRGAPLGVSAGL